MPVTFSAKKCAEMCYGISTMFALGTNEYGNVRCYHDPLKDMGCNCLCETAASPDGTCTHSGHSGYNLYRIGQGIKNLIFDFQYLFKNQSLIVIKIIRSNSLGFP